MFTASPPAAMPIIKGPAISSGALKRRTASMKITMAMAISVAPLARAARISAR